MDQKLQSNKVINLFFDSFDKLMIDTDNLYKKYLINKSYQNAHEIKIENQKIFVLIKENINIFEKSEQVNLMKILNHLSSWDKQWNDHYKLKSYKNNDEFCFKSNKKFPKDSIKHLNIFFKKSLNQNLTCEIDNE